MEHLSVRITPAVFDLRGTPTTATINGAIFTHLAGVPGGAGADKFLSIRADGIEQGYNTDAPLDLNTENPTRVFRLDRFATVNIGGVAYKAISLDVAQQNSNPSISLDDLRVYAAPISNLSGYNPATGTLGGFSPIYDLDADGDNTILLQGVGSGQADMFFLVPLSLFAGQGTNPFVYLYSRFGATPGFEANNGQEVWEADSTSNYPRADLAVTKSDSQSTEVPGTAVTYTITVRNNGPTTVNRFTFSDVIPPEILLGTTTFGAPSAGTLNLTLDAATRTYSGTWDGLTLATNQFVTVTLTATVDPLATGTMTNTVSVFTSPFQADPNIANNTASDTDILTPQVDLSITKDDHSPTAVPGTSVTYDVTVSNAGPSTVTSIQLVDTFTPTLTNLRATLPPGAVFDVGTGILSGIVLAAGDTIQGTVTGDIPSSATGTLTNRITVSPPTGVTDTDPTDNTAVDIDTMTPFADLRISKTDTTDIVFPGEALAYTITVDNLGPSDVTAAHVTDFFAAVIVSHPWFVLSATTGAFAVPATGGPATDLDTFVTIPAGGALVFQVDRVISPAALPGLLVNTTIVDPPLGVTDPDLSNNTSTHTDTIVPDPTRVDLAIVKSHAPEPAVPGQVVTYTITATNLGPIAVTAASVLDTFFGTPGLAGFNTLNWAATFTSPGSVSYNLGGAGALNDTVDLLPLGFITYTITGSINPSARGQIINTVEIFTPPGITDIDTSNNRAADIVTLNAVADLAVDKTHSPELAIPGQSVVFTVTMTNNGPSTINIASLTDIIPPDLTLVGNFTPSVGTYNSVLGLWTGLNLAIGDSVTMTFTTDISAGATGTRTNTVEVMPIGATDPDLTNNTDADQINLQPTVDVSVTKNDGATEVIPGTLTIYTMVVRNPGPSNAPGVVVTDTFPAAQFSSVTWTSAAAGGATGNQPSGTGDINDAIDLPVGGSVTYTVRALVNPLATGFLVNTVTATVPPGIVDTDLTNNTAVDTDTLIPTADLAVRKSSNRTVVAPGAALIYTIRVTNLGPSSVASFQLTDLFPRMFTPATYVPSAGVFNPATGQWTVNLAQGQTVTLRITGRVSVAARGLLVNRVRVDPPIGVTDPNFGNNTAINRVLVYLAPIAIPTASKRWFFF